MKWIPLNELPICITQYCEKNNLSHEEFGKLLGVSRHSVNDWIAGRCYPKIIIYEKILRLFQESDTK